MTSFGKYEVLELIGEGGFSRVYQGYDPTLKRHVAIKVVSLSAPQARERFMREAEIAANLHHPHIVTIFDFGEQDGQPYLVQEFLVGRDLADLIRAGDAGDLRTRIGYLIQAADGLHHAHSMGVVHRDVKPGNLRVLGDGSVRVMDFGIAKTLDTEHDLTATGMSVGTSGYLSPEQLEGIEIDHRADMFSFGVVAYELLTGRKPFPGETVTAVLYRILNEEPIALNSLAPETPARLAACIDRCLRKQPAERQADLAEVMVELRTVLAELDQGIGTPGIGTPTYAADPAAGATAAFMGGQPGPLPPAPDPTARVALEQDAPESTDSWLRNRKTAFVAGVLVIAAAGLWGAVSVARAMMGGDRGPALVVAAAADSGVSDPTEPDRDPIGAQREAPPVDPAGSAGAAAAGTGEVAAGTGASGGAGSEGLPLNPSNRANPPRTGERVDAGAGAGTGAEVSSSVPVVDPDRVVILLQGEVPDAVRLAETTLLGELTARGRPVVEQSAVTEARASAAARRAAAAGEATPIAALGRELGAGTVFVGTLMVDATMAVAGIVTGSAVLDARFYDSVTGALILAEKFQIGAGGVPGRPGTSELDAISQAAEAVARQAARAILRQTGTAR